VVVEDSDIFGDGVKIGAQLEGLAEHGGVYLSARVKDDAAVKVDCLRDLASYGLQLRYIAQPARIYGGRVAAFRRPA
jgi:class 3 adenylate cyclase